MNPCPCGGPSYRDCCRPFHQGQPAPTAEALMRSRYSAFALGLVDYLIATLDPEKRGPGLRASLQDSLNSLRWHGLSIVKCEAGGPRDETGVVEFRAVFESETRGLLCERSRFRRLDGRWFYTDGDPRPAPKPGRNEPCWCASGRKFKKCHG